MKKTTIILTGLVTLILIASNVYAIEMQLDVFKDPNSMIPTSYAKIVKDSNGKEKLVFNDNGSAYSPFDLNHIIEAYGVTMSPEAFKDPNSMIPTSYAKIVKDSNGKEKLVFNDNGSGYSPFDLNHILSAYM